MPLTGLRVLIADASLPTRAQLRAIVEGLGAAEVVEAGALEDTVAALGGAETHIMLCGARFSDGRSGAQLLEALRARDMPAPATMVVVVGGERTARSVAAVAELGPDAVIVKPFSRHDVAQRLSRFHLRRQRLRALADDVEAGRVVAAIEACRQLAAEQPSLHSEAYRLICERLFAHGRFELLAPLLREAMAVRPLPWGLLAVARLRQREQQLEAACRIVESVVQKWPTYLAAYDLLAQLNEQLGDSQAALHWLERAAEISSFSLKRLRRSGEIALRSGDLDRAEQAFARIVERGGPPPPAGSADYANLVQVMLARGRFDAARRVLDDEAERLGEAHADAQLTRILFELARARRDAEPAAVDAALDALTQCVLAGIGELSTTLLLQGLEVCAEFGRHEAGYPLAQQIAHSGRVDRLVLQRARVLVDQLRRRARPARAPAEGAQALGEAAQADDRAAEAA
ncbi:MAG: response regulator [Burkholderiaceae bacterium]